MKKIIVLKKLRKILVDAKGEEWTKDNFRQTIGFLFKLPHSKWNTPRQEAKLIKYINKLSNNTPLDDAQIWNLIYETKRSKLKDKVKHRDFLKPPVIQFLDADGNEIQQAEVVNQN